MADAAVVSRIRVDLRQEGRDVTQCPFDRTPGAHDRRQITVRGTDDLDDVTTSVAPAAREVGKALGGPPLARRASAGMDGKDGALAYSEELPDPRRRCGHRPAKSRRELAKTDVSPIRHGRVVVVIVAYDRKNVGPLGKRSQTPLDGGVACTDPRIETRPIAEPGGNP